MYLAKGQTSSHLTLMASSSLDVDASIVRWNIDRYALIRVIDGNALLSLDHFSILPRFWKRSRYRLLPIREIEKDHGDLFPVSGLSFVRHYSVAGSGISVVVKEGIWTLERAERGVVA